MVVRPHLTRGGRRLHLKSGLSLAEVLVVLVISSLVLSIVLPLAARSVADNLRIGLYGLNAQDLSLREASYRRLLQSAMQPRARAGENQITDTLQGQSDAVSLTVLSAQDNACAGAGQLTPIALRIVRADDKLVLRCVSANRSRDVLEIEGEADARFSYSLDGFEWFDHWPLQDHTGQRLVVEAPLVTLTVVSQSRRISWVERAGRAAPVNFDLRPLGQSQGDVRREGIVAP